MALSKKRVLIACGGTGGHLAPGIALAQKLISRGHTCEMLISSKQVDQRLSQKYPNLTFRALTAIGMEKSPKGLIKFAWSQLSSIGRCGKIMHDFRPHAVVGFGGFTTVSAALSATLRGVPLFLHEANYKVGRTIRILKHLATNVYLPPGIEKHSIPQNKVIELSMPLRADLESTTREEARKLLGFSLRGRLLVILGGSQGASSLNRWATDNLDALLAAGIHVYCVMGPGKGEERAVEHQLPLGQVAKAVFVPFSDQMHVLYTAADLVIARAGAGTIAELIHFGTPSILLPYPFAADDHQRANAAHVERQGGAIVVDESNLDNLMNEVLYTFKSDTLLGSLKEKLQKIDLGDPALVITEKIENLKTSAAAPALSANNLPQKFTLELKKARVDADVIRLAFDEPLGPKTTFGIGGPARVWAEPTTPKELAILLKTARKLGLPTFCIGRGSNLLVLDKGFEGLVYRLSHANWQKLEKLKNNRLRAWAGVRLKALCGEAIRLGLQGFEFMEGIPATVGGAARMNAGAFGSWFYDRVERLCVLTPDGHQKELAPQELRPAYRSVPGLGNSVVLWVIFKAAQTTPSDFLKETAEGYQTKRKASQPREASAGCVFKNPSKELGAGKAIDETGLKGLTVGQAKVSELHANFIVNTGAATAEEVISLINQVRREVWASKKVLLEVEIMLLGGDWKDYLLPIDNE